MNKEQKTAVVAELTEELKGADAIFAVDYRGISVPQAAELRSGLRDADARFRVVKNRLTLRAADEAGTEPLKEHLSGPTALALVSGDVALAAKTIHRLGSEWELLTYKGGLMDGEDLDPDSFKTIARLPGRDALNAQFAGIVASPLTGLVRGLGSMVQGLASQLQQMADQGLVEGEAPAEEKPAEDEKAAEQEAPAAEERPAEDESPEAEEDQAEEAPSEAPAAGSGADPEPAESPEETTEEEPAPGEEVPSEEASPPEETEEPVAEGDAEIGSAQTSEDSDDEKEKEDDA